MTDQQLQEWKEASITQAEKQMLMELRSTFSNNPFIGLVAPY